MSLTYRRDIDGLRAIAVLAVVLFHLDPALLPGGFSGVDIFFVISGFLITSIVSRSTLNNTFSVLEFYKRRILRLYPALLSMLFVTAVVAWFTFYEDELALYAEHAVAGLWYFMNFQLRSEAGYFDTSADFKPLLHLWSLSIEEQFYLFFPLLLLLFRSKRAHRSISIAVLLLSATTNAYMHITEVSPPFFFSPARFWQIAAGSLLATSNLNVRELPIPRGLLTYLGLAMILVAIIFSPQSDLNPSAWALLPVIGTFLLIATGAEDAPILKTVLSSRLMVGIGLISYPLYLWHWPILSVLKITMPTHRPFALDVAGVLLAFILAAATYLFLEKPLRHNAAPGRWAALLLGTSCLLTIAFLVIAHNSGFKDRAANLPIENIKAQMTRTPAKDDTCEAFVGEKVRVDYCRIAKTDSATEMVALIGDSHAHALFPGIARHLSKNGKSLVLLANSSCPMLLEVDTEETKELEEECENKKKQILSILRRQSEIKQIILATRGEYYISGIGYGPAESKKLRGLRSRRQETSGYSGAELFAYGLRNLVVQLHDRPEPTSTQRQKTVVTYFLQVPEVGLAPYQCVSRIGQSLCSRPASDVREAHGRYRKAVESVSEIDRVIDPLPAACPADRCEAFSDGVPLYADDNHLSTKGSEILIQRMNDELKRAEL